MDERSVATADELVRVGLELGSDADDGTASWWFRGQARRTWPLLPGLYRRVTGVAQALDVERQFHREFDNRSRLLVERRLAENPWEMMFLMQHHAVPTRLLDWSRSLLIAAYFAVADVESGVDQHDPPCVYALNPSGWNACAAGPLGYSQIGGDGVFSSNQADSLTLVGGYAPRVPGQQAGTGQKYAIAMAGPEFAPRMVAQRGVFTVFGTDHDAGAKPLGEQAKLIDATEHLRVFTLGGDIDQWRRELRLLGVGPFTAFPDLDGLAQELKEKYLP